MVEHDLHLKADTIVFSGTPADDKMMVMARNYAKEKRLTSDKVKLYKAQDQVCLRLKVDVTYPCGKRSELNEQNTDRPVEGGGNGIQE